MKYIYCLGKGVLEERGGGTGVIEERDRGTGVISDLGRGVLEEIGKGVLEERGKGVEVGVGCSILPASYPLQYPKPNATTNKIKTKTIAFPTYLKELFIPTSLLKLIR